MKKELARVIFIGMLLFISASSCKKGDTGLAGTPGTDGKDGKDGNANISMYTFEERTFTGNTNFILENISQARIDSSLILVYYNPISESATAWYPVPGLGSGAIYQTRFLIYQTQTSPSTYTLRLFLMNPATTTAYANSVSFRKTRIIIAPASAINTSGRKKSNDETSIFSDYYATLRYFNLEE